jgi:uncharacterized membrane protein
VLQGTVLGPVLFTVFIDDLELETVKLKLEVFITKFADVTKGQKEIRGEEDRKKMQEALTAFGLLSEMKYAVQLGQMQTASS